MVTALLYKPFPLWWVNRVRPELKDTAVVVGQGARVMHASARARQQGIEVGMSLDAAKLRAEKLEVVPFDAPALQGAWEACLDDLYSFTPWLEPIRLGWVVARLEVVEARQLAGAHELRVGIATSQEVALLAALTAFEGHVRLVLPEDEAGFLARVPVRFLRSFGLSRESIARLYWLGIERLEDLKDWRYAQLEAYLGREAKAIKPLLYGPWREDVLLYRPPQTIKASYDFEDTAREPYEILPVLELLSQQVVERLRDRAASRLKLRVTSRGLDFLASRIPKRPLRQVDEVFRLATLALDDTGATPFGIDSLELELASLFRPAYQGSLWDLRERQERAIEAVSARFPGTVFTYHLVDPWTLAPDAMYAPLSFGRSEKEAKDAPSIRSAQGRAERSGSPAHAALRN